MGVEAHVRFQEPGVFTAEFARSKPGKYSVIVKADQLKVAGSPFEFEIAEKEDPLQRLMKSPRKSPPVSADSEDAAAAAEARKVRQQQEEEEEEELRRRR